MFKLKSSKITYHGRYTQYNFINIGDNMTTASYWESRYQSGRNSGNGSYGVLGKYKADTINKIITNNNIKTVGDFGCGDGNVLSMCRVPKYLGVDITMAAINKCTKRFIGDTTKQFILYNQFDDGKYPPFDMSMSIDVIFHLLESRLFDGYMRRLFNSSNKWVLIYSSDLDDNITKSAPHVKHHKFTDWIKSNVGNKWSLHEYLSNPYPLSPKLKSGSFCNFYLYRKN